MDRREVNVPNWVGEAKRTDFSGHVLRKQPASDWYDPRLKQAYKLIDQVLDSTICAKDSLRKAAEAVEDADLHLEQGHGPTPEEYDDRPEWEMRTGFREEDFS